jgi:uncharacterized protein YdeI (YjbR/CyaY-like superfamily)
MPDALYFPDAAAFRAWLADHAATSTSLMVGFHRVATGRPTMTWSESVDEALCFGWIDGRRNRVDEDRYTIRFTPRKAGSIWSLVNIAKMDALRAQGRMTAAGEAAFALRSAAKSGIYSHERAAPAVLSRAETALFRRNKAAWTFFDAAPAGYRNVMLHWVTGAKREATRTSRLDKLIAASSVGERIRFW